MKMRSGGIVALIVILIMPFVLVQSLSAAPDAQEPEAVERDTQPPTVADPNAVISIDQDRVVMDVQRPQTTQMTLNGVVTADIIWLPMIQYLVVSLTYSLEGGVVVGTSQVIFSKGIDSQPFQCDVHMPVGKRNGEYNLTVLGTWRYSPGTITGPAQPDSAIIEVPPYSAPILYFPKKERTVKVGGECEYTIWIVNRGNCDDNITIEYSSEGPVEVSGPSTILLFYDENTTIVVRARQTGGMPRVNNIMIAISGSHGGMSPSSAAEFQLETEMSPSVFSVWLLLPLLLIIIIVSGITVRIVLSRRRRSRIDTSFR
jgi:hypothetical protein